MLKLLLFKREWFVVRTESLTPTRGSDRHLPSKSTVLLLTALNDPNLYLLLDLVKIHYRF